MAANIDFPFSRSLQFESQSERSASPSTASDADEIRQEGPGIAEAISPMRPAFIRSSTAPRLSTMSTPVSWDGRHKKTDKNPEHNKDRRLSYSDPTVWLQSPTCHHCGNLAPRPGALTIYGTPVASKIDVSASVTNEKSRPASDVGSWQSSSNNSYSKHEDLYLIEKVHDVDDVNFNHAWKRRLHKLTPFLSCLSVLAYSAYLTARIYCTRNAEIVAHKKFLMAWVFVAVELGSAFPMFLHQSWQLFALKGRSRRKLRLVGNTCPTVDVFVTCCGEEHDIIIDTVRAAASQNYPEDRYRVVVLDDAGDKELEQKLKDVTLHFPHVHYHSRTKIPGVPHHYKAGNLNGGLAYVDNLPGGPGEYMAALDADMIASEEWLRAIIAHLVLDPKMAMSCPPQLFYNVPKDDPLLQSLDCFVHIAEPVKDAAGVAWCTGSGYAMRRAALTSIGNFPTGSLAEDVCTSSMLLGDGWTTAYIHEPLQYGTVPETFVGHIKQRTRWTIGTVQTSVKLNFCLFGPLVREMSLFQRVSGFVYTMSSLFTLFLTASLFTVPVVLISGGTLVAFADYDQLRWQIRTCFFAFLTTRLAEYVTNLPAGYRLGRMESQTMLWMAPFHSIAIIRAFLLPKWLGGKQAAFSSTGSISSDLNERYPALRAPLWARLRTILFGCHAWTLLVYIVFLITAVALSTARAFMDGRMQDRSAVLLYLLTHAFWPPLLWSNCLFACWRPIKYAIWPPTMKDREELLDRDPDTLIARPKAEAKKVQWSKTSALSEVRYTLLTALSLVTFVGSWIY